MKIIMIMYDSLNRNYLPNYGGDTTRLPNFERLGRRTATFENNYAGSLPCMPARRELHTGRYNFLHREWGPLEPFDDSMPELLKKAGIYTHLVSDHSHYWEDGGATYHGRYNSWQNVRGQEADPWIGDILAKDDGCYMQPVQVPTANNMRRQDSINRHYIKSRGEYPQQETFRLGREFIEKNHNADQWFLQIETFDPHEPFFVPERFLDKEKEAENSYDWPYYGMVNEDDIIVEGVRSKYRALLRMCDECLGEVLDMMDKYQMWDDTMLIVNTDHGFLLGEREWWGKNIMPLYNELVRTPLFIWDPRSKCKDERRNALTQTIDLAPTILDYFDIDIPKDMQGVSLKQVISKDVKIRDYALYGNFGSHINITDGNWFYMRGPHNINNEPLNCYTLTPQHLPGRMPVATLQKSVLQEPFSFTKGCPVLKFPVFDFFNSISPKFRYGNKLMRLSEDGKDQVKVTDKEMEVHLINEMRRLMFQNEAPDEQYQRIGICKDREITINDLLADDDARSDMLKPNVQGYHWTEKAVWEYNTLCQMTGREIPEDKLATALEMIISKKKTRMIDEADILALANEVISPEMRSNAIYTLKSIGKLE